MGNVRFHAFDRRKTILVIVCIVLFSAKYMTAFSAGELEDLPISEYMSDHGKSTYIIYISGDGGMNNFSKSLCKSFQEQGYSVVAFDAKKYFWKAKTPDAFNQVISEVIVHYQQIWKSESFLLVGYSFGADVGAFLPDRLPENLQKSMKLAAMLDPSVSTDFEIKLADMLGGNSENRKYSILNELNSNKNERIVCLFSDDEENGLKKKIVNKNLRIESLPGDHRFNNDYQLITTKILNSF